MTKTTKTTKAKAAKLSPRAQAHLDALNAVTADKPSKPAHQALDVLDFQLMNAKADGTAKPVKLARKVAIPANQDMRQPAASPLEATGREKLATAMGTKPAKMAALGSTHEVGLTANPAKQIAALKQAIDAENAYIRNLLSRGDFEAVAKRLEWQIRRKARIGELSMKWQAVKASQPVTVETVARKAKVRMIIKPKRYSRWSDNPVK